MLSDLVGVVQEIQPGTTYDTVVNRYTSGTIDLYIDTNMDADYNVNGTTGTLDLGDDFGFNTGDTVAQVTEVTGVGSSTFLAGTNTFETGSYDISGVFTQMMTGFWFTEDGNDMASMNNYNFDWFIGIADGNIDKVEQDFSNATSTSAAPLSGGVLYTIDSDSNASFEVTPVPEPATMFLLASAFLGLGMVSKKRIVK